jgi:hypothetical protein
MAGGGARGDGFVAAGTGFAHGVEGFGVSHQSGGVAIAQCASRREGQCDCSGRDIIRHFSDEHSVMLTESKVRVLDFASQLFDGSANGVKAILRIGNEARERLRCITNLVEIERHEVPPVCDVRYEVRALCLSKLYTRGGKVGWFRCRKEEEEEGGTRKDAGRKGPREKEELPDLIELAGWSNVGPKKRRIWFGLNLGDKLN